MQNLKIKKIYFNYLMTSLISLGQSLATKLVVS